MSPAELRLQLRRCGYSQRKAAQLLGIDDRTMRRYVSGASSVPRTVELALRYLELLNASEG